MILQNNIRNFCIIAHIDHGKSTLADRFLEQARVVDTRMFHNQMLDSMDIEQERGITIKSQAVHFPYVYKEHTYYFNLVDTPGHVDFSYEVSRAISSCEGALLLVDATQGIEAQTLSNFYIAFSHDLHIVPVINKIDLPMANVTRVSQQIEHELGLDASSAVLVSAKNGLGIDNLFEKIVQDIPSPHGNREKPFCAQVFDSHYDPYIGVVLHVRVMDGVLRPASTIMSMATEKKYTVENIGHFVISMLQAQELGPGEIGFVTAGIKNIGDIRVGDTITDVLKPALKPLPGYQEIKPFVFSSAYPVDANNFDDLTKGLEKLALNDASLVYEKDSSNSLGTGYRCGFLGLLHLEIIQERLEREFDLSVIFTAPSVQYEVELKTSEVINVSQPDHLPDAQQIVQTREPYIKASIICPEDYIGNVLALCNGKRGVQKSLHYIDKTRVELVYEMPLAEIFYKFYDSLKSVSKGYASFDYEIIDYKEVALVCLDILVNGKKIDAFSGLLCKENASSLARDICKKLKEEIPRHQFTIAIQGAIGNQIVARETVSAYRKDVTAKCYGGDITRKRKLLERQKEGKKKMKMVGNIEVPQKAFLAVLKSSPTTT